MTSEAFSPLFIGEGSSTMFCCTSACARSGFQSPLHRGRVFNAHSPFFALGIVRLLSVPSSSGKGLQLIYQPRRVHQFWRLSVPSSSGKGLQQSQVSRSARRRDGLSVPSSSGKGLQQRLLGWGSSAFHSFSPLFIGEGSSTSEMSDEFRAPMNFQSPLHRGRVFNLLHQKLNPPLPALSVPSSSGKGLQHSQRRPDGKGGWILSVPSSSGKGLQQGIRENSRQVH